MKNFLANSLKIFNITLHHGNWKNMLVESMRNDQHSVLKRKYLFCFSTIPLCFFMSFGRVSSAHHNEIISHTFQSILIQLLLLLITFYGTKHSIGCCGGKQDDIELSWLSSHTLVKKAAMYTVSSKQDQHSASIVQERYIAGWWLGRDVL